MKTKIVALMIIMALACPLGAKITQAGFLASQERIKTLEQSFQSAFKNLLDQIKSHYTVTINPCDKQVALNNITVMLTNMQSQINDAGKEVDTFGMRA